MDLFISSKKDCTVSKSEIIGKRHFLWWRGPLKPRVKRVLKLSGREKDWLWPMDFSPPVPIISMQETMTLFQNGTEVETSSTTDM
jgi:hypothetical protein